MAPTRPLPDWVPREVAGKEDRTGFIATPESSWINGIKYTREGGAEMMTGNGRTYNYPGLGLEQFRRWVAAKSKGKYWWRHVGHVMRNSTFKTKASRRGTPLKFTAHNPAALSFNPNEPLTSGAGYSHSPSTRDMVRELHPNEPDMTKGRFLEHYNTAIANAFSNPTRDTVDLARRHGNLLFFGPLLGSAKLDPKTSSVKGYGVHYLSPIKPRDPVSSGDGTERYGDLNTIRGGMVPELRRPPLPEPIVNAWQGLMADHSFLTHLYGLFLRNNSIQRINPEYIPLLRRIHSTPFDAAPRLVFADQLQEHHDQHPLMDAYGNYIRSDANYGASIVDGKPSAKFRSSYLKHKPTDAELGRIEQPPRPPGSLRLLPGEFRQAAREISPLPYTSLVELGNALRKQQGQKPVKMSRWTGAVHPVMRSESADGPMKFHFMSQMTPNEVLNWVRSRIHSSASMRHIAALTGWLPGTQTTVYGLGPGGRMLRSEHDEPTELHFSTSAPNEQYERSMHLQLKPGGGVDVHNDLIEIPQVKGNPYRGVSPALYLRQMRAAHEVGLPLIKYHAAWMPPDDPLSGLFRSSETGRPITFTGGQHWPLIGGNGILPKNYTLPPDIVHEADVASGGRFSKTRLISDLFASPRAKEHYLEHPTTHEGFLETAPGTYSRVATEKYVNEQAAKHGMAQATPDASHASTLAPLRMSRYTKYHPMVSHVLDSGMLHPEFIDEYYR